MDWSSELTSIYTISFVISLYLILVIDVKYMKLDFFTKPNKM
jgi:hypothetical protein